MKLKHQHLHVRLNVWTIRCNKERYASLQTLYTIEIQAKQPSESYTYKLLCLHSDDRDTNMEIRTLTWREEMRLHILVSGNDYFM